MLSCTTCHKGPPDVRVRLCAGCSETPYCSQACQRQDWTAHKKVCGRQSGRGHSGSSTSGESAGSSHATGAKGLEGPVDKPFTRLSNGTWLHDRPAMDVYRLLIDAYRLRVEDTYKYDGVVYPGSIYAGVPNGLRGFRSFLSRVQAKKGLLPPWWNAKTKAACEALGVNAPAPDAWSSLRMAVEKSDIIEHYGDARFPMQLRMFAEQALGTGVGGANGAAMMAMMAATE